MSWVALVGGFLLGPTVGSVASRVVSEVLKPKDMSNTLLIGAVAHAASAYAFSHFSRQAHDPGWHSFTRGALWGEGVSAATLAAGGIVLKTDAGKKMTEGVNWEASIDARGTPVRGVPMISTASPSSLPRASSPAGLLGFLTMARKSGYT